MNRSLVPLKPRQLPVAMLPKFTTDLPFFYHTKRRDLLTRTVNFHSEDEQGRPVKWKVTPNIHPSIGAPGIEAHQVWVRLLKPAFDAARDRAGGETPSIVPLGSVRECLRVLGWTIGGFQSRDFIKTLNQIGSAWCEVDFWLPTARRNEEGELLFRHIKGSFSRLTLYAVGSKHVTDDEIRAGRVNFDFDLEDTVYVQLHPIEVEIQRNQPQRPVDNEYLFSVSPDGRRWYELIAPSIFGVTNNRGPGYCEIRYSWYIERHHTLTRQTERRRVVQQMNKLIKDHLAFGYVARVDYIEAREPNEKIDFIIRYYPGDGAKESTKRIRSRTGIRALETSKAQPPNRQEQLPLGLDPSTTTGAVNPPHGSEDDRLVAELVSHGMSDTTAIVLVKEQPDEVRRQLEYLLYRTVKKNKGGLLRDAIVGRWTPPDEYLKLKQREQEQQESTESARKRKAQEAEAESRRKDEERHKAAHAEYLKGLLARAEKKQPAKYEAFLEESAAKRRAIENDPANAGAARRIHLMLFDDPETYLDRARDFFGGMSFEEWKRKNV